VSLAIHQADSTANELLGAAKQRLDMLTSERQALEDRRTQIDADLERINAEVGHLEGLLSLHGAGREPSHSIPQVGGSAADHVVEVIREAHTPLHFREIERRMRAKGISTAGGQDPANTLLAKYFNDPRLYRPARGTYGLREWQPGAASVGTKKRERRGA